MKLKIKCEFCNKFFKRYISLIKYNKERGSKNYCSRKCLCKSHEKNWVGKNNHFYGKKHTEETKKKISLNHVNISGKRHPNWKGGITAKNTKERLSSKNIQFIKRILKRDNYTCVICNESYSGEMVVDHVLAWSLHPELRQNPKNVRTLCKPCHKKYGANPRFNKKASWPTKENL